MLDLGFIIDSSGSIGKGGWNRLMRFLMSVTSKLNVSESRTHVGALTFDTETRMEFDFNDEQNTDAVNARFAGMVWHRGYTHTDSGMKLAIESLFTYAEGMRAAAPKVSERDVRTNASPLSRT